jgi:hypothetical protein
MTVCFLDFADSLDFIWILFFWFLWLCLANGIGLNAEGDSMGHWKKRVSRNRSGHRGH